MEIEYVEGKANVIADAQSRLPVGEPTPPMDEEAFDVPHHLPENCYFETISISEEFEQPDLVR